MRKFLCALLVASPWCPAIAQDASPLAFTEAKIEVVPFSLSERLRTRDIQVAGAEAPPQGAMRIRVVAHPIVFPPPDAKAAGDAGVARRALEAQFPYDPAPHAASEDKSGENEGAPVKMEPYHVSERRDREAAVAIDEKRWEEDAKAFRLRSGGRLLKGSIGGYPVEVGFTAHRDLIPIPFSTRPEWDLFTLVW